MKVDAWVGDKFTGIDLVKAQKGKLQQGDMLYAERIAMAVKKGNSSLLKESASPNPCTLCTASPDSHCLFRYFPG